MHDIVLPRKVLKIHIARYTGNDASVFCFKKSKSLIITSLSLSFDNFFQWTAKNVCDHSSWNLKSTNMEDYEDHN